MNDCENYGGADAPYQRRRLDCIIRCYKGGSGAAVEEQRKAREQSAAQFQEQMAFMRKQYEDAQKIKTPVYAPAAPSASGSPDVYAASMEARRRQLRRFGSAATVLQAPAAR